MAAHPGPPSPGGERFHPRPRATIGLESGTRIRSLPVALLTMMVGVYFLDWAEAVLLPLVVGVLLSYAFDPILAPLDRFNLPRSVSAALLLVAVVALLGASVMPLQQQTMAMLDKVPVAVARFQQNASKDVDLEGGVLEKAQQAAKHIERVAARDRSETPAVRQGVTPVQIVDRPFDIREHLMTGASGAMVVASQVVSVLFLVYFLLATGNLYRRKVVRMAGPSFRNRREMLRVLMEFHRQVRRFLFVTLLSAVLVGFFSWLLFAMLGFDEAIFWGVAAGIASAVPYLGPFMVAVGTAIAAFIQFGTLEMALLISGGSMVITSIQGYLLLPVLTARVSSLNTVAIFVGLLFWGWLWGVVGLVIATPLLMMIKTSCDYVRGLRHIGELLGK